MRTLDLWFSPPFNTGQHAFLSLSDYLVGVRPISALYRSGRPRQSPRVGGTLCRSLFRLVSAVLAAVVITGCAAPRPAIPETTAQTLQTLHGDLLQARTATEFYVRTIRRQFPANSAQLVGGERLYEEARGGVNGWLADVQQMVRSGVPVSDDILGPKRKAASDAVVEFNTFADRAIKEKMASDPAAKDLKFFPVISVTDVFTLGRSIADEVGKRRQAQHDAYERWAQAESAKLEQDRWSGFSDVK